MLQGVPDGFAVKACSSSDLAGTGDGGVGHWVGDGPEVEGRPEFGVGQAGGHGGQGLLGGPEGLGQLPIIGIM